MNQEKIGKFIKSLRIKNGYSQSQLAAKLNVTSQAVSKWERGRGLPDIELLHKLSDVFQITLEELIQGESNKLPNRMKKKKKIWIFGTIGVIVIIIASIGFFSLLKNKTFNFSSLASDNDEFSIKGVIAYDNNKKSIYISDIDYANDENEEEYVVLECILYEVDKNKEMKISQCGDIKQAKKYNAKNAATLSSLLKEVEFNIDDYSCSCSTKNCKNLYLKINALNIENKIVTYNIPIQVDNQCAIKK